MTQELRRLAEAVTQTTSMSVNTAYNAAANPAAILSLLDRLEKAEKDAERYRWLRERYTAVDFDWEESGQQAVIFTSDDFPVATASCDETIDRAMEASK